MHPHIFNAPQADGSIMKEAAYINRSLTFLEQVWSHLSSQSPSNTYAGRPCYY